MKFSFFNVKNGKKLERKKTLVFFVCNFMFLLDAELVHVMILIFTIFFDSFLIRKRKKGFPRKIQFILL
jgi:chromate transport protein ChrA